MSQQRNIKKFSLYAFLVFAIGLGTVGCGVLKVVGYGTLACLTLGSAVHTTIKYEHKGTIKRVEVKEKNTVIYFEDDISYEVIGHPSVMPGYFVHIEKIENGFKVKSPHIK